MPTPDQYRAWAYYGLPSDTQQVLRPTDRVPRPIGELGFVVDWIADQLGRLEWRVLVNGSESWRLKTSSGQTVASDAASADPESESHPTKASTVILDEIDWSPQTVKLLATNLFVAGECHYVYRLRRGRPSPTSPQGHWEVVSVIRPKAKELIESATHPIHALWPHPADPTRPNAPVVGALPILSTLDWLSRLQDAQSGTRIGMRGIVGIADTMATASGKPFWNELEDAVQSQMADPDNLAPVVVRGPEALVEPAGNGMKGLSWMIPDFPFDDRIDAKIGQAIQRLAYSLPIPPEVLLGMQAQSKATAFQVEHTSYTQFIEPPATLIACTAAEALTLLLGTPVTVTADPTRLLARRSSVQDVLDAFDRGIVARSYVREVLGIPEHAAATDEDLAVLYQLHGRSDAEATPDPSASAAAPPAPSQRASLTDARSYLEGAASQAVDRARERVGAKARTRPELRAQVAMEIPNQQVAAALTTAVLTDAGVPVRECVSHAIQPFVDDIATRFSDLDAAALHDRLAEYILDTLDEDRPACPTLLA